MNIAKGNRGYRDSVFTDLFYTDDKAEENLLSVYNALYGTEYTDPTVIRKLRIEQVLFMNFKNDVAFSVQDRRIILHEHQSTVNPNIPLRNLMYIAREYEMLVPVRERYRTRLVNILTPNFITFYNGDEEYPDEQILKLSDAYAVHDAIPALELTTRVININSGHNPELMAKCPVLKEYTDFVETTKKYGTDKDALEKAVKECIAKGILREYLLRRGAEVVNLLMAEYDYATDIEVHAEDAAEKAAKETAERVTKEVKLDGAKRLIRMNLLTVEQIAEAIDLPVTEIRKLKEEI